ncbi:MAG: alpha/beta fold hydrolase [Hyphomicrobiales bacterium]|nr:alpha/beta fold hydrolase [Hyphomicrobiales bacterium]MCP5370608.1 alpha/beta fold hydrolase [Hyphomicrobiales bacterium]
MSAAGPAWIADLERAARRHAAPFGGGTLAIRQWGPEPGGGDLPPLVLLHGGFGSWKHWARNIPGLATAFTVYAIDLPGLGDSHPAPEPHTATGIAAIVAAGIDRALGPHRAFFLAAFSLGAVVSAPLVRDLGARVCHAVLIGAGGLGGMWFNAVADQRRRSLSMTEDELREVVRENLGRSMIGDPARIDEDTVTLQLGLLNQKRRLIGLPLSQSTIVRDCLPAIRDRTTLLWGEHDPYLLPDLPGALEILCAECPGLDARIIADAGHWANYEQPEIVNGLIRGLA